MPRSLPLLPADPVALTVDALSSQGEGLAAYGPYTCFIPGVLPGEVVRVRLGQPFARGSARVPGAVEEIVKPHAERAAPFCPYFGRCGGCALQHASLHLQARIKEGQIKAALLKAGLRHEDIKAVFKPLVQCSRTPETVCRFKSMRRFALENGQVISGYYAVRSHDLIAVPSCPLEPAWMWRCAEAVCHAASQSKILPFDESSGQGLLRALTLREGDPGERLALLTAAAPLPDDFTAKLKELAPEHGLTCLAVTLQSGAGNQVNGRSAEVIWGAEHIFKSCGDISLATAPLAFMQVNHQVSERLYQAAVDHCGRGARAVDIGCGSGVMTLLLARRFDKVTGVEIVPAAVEAARGNAQRCKLGNADFVLGDFSAYLAHEMKAGAGVDAFIADPARAGLGPKACRALGQLNAPVKGSLIFCALTALTRDLPLLLQAGYKLKAVQGFDMFVHSMHVETLCLIEKD